MNAKTDGGSGPGQLGMPGHLGMIVLNILIALAIGYSFVIVAMFLAQRSFMYFPDTAAHDPASSFAPEMRVVTYPTGDGLEISSWYHPPAPGGTVILHLHGNAGSVANRDARARQFIDMGYGVLLAEYRGYGPNPGEPDEPGLQMDGRAAIDFLVANAVAPGNIIAYGESLGSGVAVRAAMDMAFEGTPLAALVLEAPFSSAVDVARSHYPFFPVKLLMKDRFESEPLISAVRAPVLVMHGLDDTVIPVRFGQKLFDATLEPRESHWLEGAGHNDLYDFGAGEIVARFLAKYAPATGR